MLKLREEFQLNYGVKCYDWEYIEENSSLPLLLELVDKKCASSCFPDVAGISKLCAMVRLNVPSVKEAYEHKRRDVRFAITHAGFCRDRSKHLPDIPSAPASFDPPLLRKNGTNVLDLMKAKRSCSDDNDSDICIDADTEEDENEHPCENIGSSQVNHNCLDGSGCTSMDEKGKLEDDKSGSFPCEKNGSVSQNSNDCDQEQGGAAIFLDKTEQSDLGVSGASNDGIGSYPCQKIGLQERSDHKDRGGDGSMDWKDEPKEGDSHRPEDSSYNKHEGGLKKQIENASSAPPSRFSSSENLSASDEESDDEVVANDDDEYELSSDCESSDDDISIE